MELLSYQSCLLLATLTLATLLAVRTVIRTAVWTGSRRAVEHSSRQRQELEVLYEPTDVSNGVSPSARRNDHVVECVFAFHSLPT